jgi:nucleoid-associated protein YgaU
VVGAAQSAEEEIATAPEKVPAVEIDLAQVRPDGNAVFAGKAPPNAKVTVFEGDVVLGTTTADASGEWVVVPEKALGAGEHLISVGAKSEDGETEVAGVTLAIRVDEAKDKQPLVALLPQSETEIPQLLQSPDDTPQTAQKVVVADATGTNAAGVTADNPSAPLAGPAIAPRSLSWKSGGELIVSGLSRGGVAVRVEADDTLFGTADIGMEGDWQVTGRVDLGRARRLMLFTLEDAEGRVVATYELPVATRDLSQGMDGSRLVIVQQGDALWRIAYRTYGEGVKYVDIVRRNAAAIDDPDLIFPNQIFAIPK